MADITAAQVKELRDKTGAAMMDAKKALVEADGSMEKAIDVLRERGVAKAAKKADRITAEGMTDIASDGDVAAIVELNSETDYVATNSDFNDLLKLVTKSLVEGKPADIDAALAMKAQGDDSLQDVITRTTATTGEKITLRRFEVLSKENNQIFGAYSHMAGKISALLVLEGGNEEVARDVAMHVAAIAPQFTSREDIPAEVVDHEREIQMATDDLQGKPDDIKEKMVEGRISKFMAEISLLDQPFVKNGDQKVSDYLTANNAKVIKFVRYQVGEGIEKNVTDLAEEVSKQLGN